MDAAATEGGALICDTRQVRYIFYLFVPSEAQVHSTSVKFYCVPRTPTSKFSKIHSAILGYLRIGYVGPTRGEKLRKPNGIRGMGGIIPNRWCSLSNVMQVECIILFHMMHQALKCITH